MSSDPNPYSWTGFLETSEATTSPGISPSTYAAIAAARASRVSPRPGAVSTLLNPSPAPPGRHDHPSFGGSPFAGMRPANRQTTGGGFMSDFDAPWQQQQQQHKPPVFDSRSRIFEHFMTRGELSEASNPLLQEPEPRRIAPSYLQGTEYMKKLEERYDRRAQEFRNRTQNGVPAPSRSSSQSLKGSKLPPPSHRGMTLNVVEKAPGTATLPEAADEVALLPTGWNTSDRHEALEVECDGLVVKYTGTRSVADKDHEACAIRADNPMPGQCGIYYFEITVLETKKDDTIIVIGFAGEKVELTRAPGWEPESWGYHGDDGNAFLGHSAGKSYGPKFGPGDTVGCLVNFRTATVSFTKNGRDLGVACRENAFRRNGQKFFPIVGLKKPGDQIIANFGQAPFIFDIDGYVKDEKKKLWDKIRKTDTQNLVPGLTETELCQQLVLQHLQHDGYVESARAFAEEIMAEKEKLRLDPNEPIKGISIRDDDDAAKRQQIRRAVLEGDIDNALQYTNNFYPKVLKTHHQVYFRLRCRKFIEMIRKDAEQNLKRDNITAVPVTKSLHHQSSHFNEDEDMEMDQDNNNNHGYVPDQWDEQMEDDQPSTYTPPAVGRLLEEALQYGQELRAEFADSNDPETTAHLDEIFALIAYQNPLMEESVVHLLDRSGRVAVAEELNSAILLSLGKQSRSALETMYADTVVLLDSLREETGGDAAFVSITDILDRIPKPDPVI